MKNGVLAVSVWENNREDSEDSATQVRRENNDIYICVLHRLFLP